jgi:hypothetical protein
MQVLVKITHLQSLSVINSTTSTYPSPLFANPSRLTLGGAKIGGFLTMGDVKIPIEVHDNEDGSYKYYSPPLKCSFY